MDINTFYSCAAFCFNLKTFPQHLIYTLYLPKKVLDAKESSCARFRASSITGRCRSQRIHPPHAQRPRTDVRPERLRHGSRPICVADPQVVVFRDHLPLRFGTSCVEVGIRERSQRIRFGRTDIFK